MSCDVFVTGGTGYIGRPLIAALVARGHRVRALVRPGSEDKLPAGAVPVRGDALDANTWVDAVWPGDTMVQLVGTPHPGPGKAAAFDAVDRVAVEQAVHVGTLRGVAHMIYLSVAHPAPVMQAYIAVRRRGETLLRGSGLPCTIVRPWYVLGPGHRWPLLLVPFYWLAERWAPTRGDARRLGLLTLPQVVNALTEAVESPPVRCRLLEVPEMRAARPSPLPQG